VSHAKRWYSAPAGAAGFLAWLWLTAWPALAQSATPTPSPTSIASPDHGWSLLIILVGSLVAATAILAGVIIYMLKMFKHRY
jgi:hypothetical protein